MLLTKWFYTKKDFVPILQELERLDANLNAISTRMMILEKRDYDRTYRRITELLREAEERHKKNDDSLQR